MYKNKIKICSNEQSWNNEVEHTHKKQIDAHRNWMISIIDHNWIACSIRLLKKKKKHQITERNKTNLAHDLTVSQTSWKWKHHKS